MIINCPECGLEVKESLLKKHLKGPICTVAKYGRKIDGNIECIHCYSTVRTSVVGIRTHLRNNNQCRVWRGDKPLEKKGFTNIEGIRYVHDNTGESLDAPHDATFYRWLKSRKLDRDSSFSKLLKTIGTL